MKASRSFLACGLWRALGLSFLVVAALKWRTIQGNQQNQISRPAHSERRLGDLGASHLAGELMRGSTETRIAHVARYD